MSQRPSVTTSAQRARAARDELFELLPVGSSLSSAGGLHRPSNGSLSSSPYGISPLSSTNWAAVRPPTAGSTAASSAGDRSSRAELFEMTSMDRTRGSSLAGSGVSSVIAQSSQFGLAAPTSVSSSHTVTSAGGSFVVSVTGGGSDVQSFLLGSLGEAMSGSLYTSASSRQGSQSSAAVQSGASERKVSNKPQARTSLAGTQEGKRSVTFEDVKEGKLSVAFEKVHTHPKDVVAPNDKGKRKSSAMNNALFDTLVQLYPSLDRTVLRAISDMAKGNLAEAKALVEAQSKGFSNGPSFDLPTTFKLGEGPKRRSVHFESSVPRAPPQPAITVETGARGSAASFDSVGQSGMFTSTLDSASFLTAHSTAIGAPSAAVAGPSSATPAPRKSTTAPTPKQYAHKTCAVGADPSLRVGPCHVNVGPDPALRRGRDARLVHGPSRRDIK